MKDNKLIAEFMGITLKGGGLTVQEEHLHLFRKTTFKEDGLCPHCHNDVAHGRNIKCFVLDESKLKYHESWDWLMPVHKKCMFTPNFSGDDQLRTLLIDAVIDADINRLYDAVVEFIKEHNG